MDNLIELKNIIFDGEEDKFFEKYSDDISVENKRQLIRYCLCSYRDVNRILGFMSPKVRMNKMLFNMALNAHEDGILYILLQLGSGNYEKDEFPYFFKRSLLRTREVSSVYHPEDVVLYKKLLEYGTDEERNKGMIMAIIEWIIEDEDDPICDREDWVRIVDLCLSLNVNLDGCDPDIGYSPLTYAITHKSIFEAEYLLKCGANPLFIDNNDKSPKQLLPVDPWKNVRNYFLK